MLSLRAWWRDAARHPWQTGLSLLGVALGVAVVVAVDLANDSARRSFERSQATVSGHATHRIVGGPDGLDEDVYRQLRSVAVEAHSAPVVEGPAQVPAAGPVPYQVFGIDPFAEITMRDYGNNDDGLPWIRLLGEPGTGFLTHGAAAALGVEPGDALSIEVDGRSSSLVVLATWQAAAGVLDRVILTDVATAQELLGREGRLSHIDLRITAPDSEPIVGRIGAVLPPGLEITSGTSRSRAQRAMTRAFRINLTALSLLGLLIGAFLIYNAMSFAVLRRRRQIGILRAVGLSKFQVFAAVMVEAAGYGLAASLLGSLLGIWLAGSLLSLVTRTIDDLYFGMGPAGMSIGMVALAKGFVLGTLAALIAACVPAIEATRAPPRAVLLRSELEATVRRGNVRAAWVGVGLIGASALVLVLPGGGVMLGFTGLFLMIFGYAMLTPTLLTSLLRWPGRSLIGRMATRGILSSLSRTGIAVAALTVAIAATVGVGVMIGSFRDSVEHWLVGQLRADVYLALPRDHARGLSESFVQQLRALPGVHTVTLGRRVAIESQDRISRVLAVDADPLAFAGFQLLTGDPESAWTAFATKGAVLITEPYAWHNGVAVGESIRLRTAHGVREFPVVGIYRDYGSDRGLITMSRATYARYWDDTRTTSAALYLDPGVDPEATIAALYRDLALPPALRVRANQTLREASLAVFDRTFTITGVLRILVVIVAAVGVMAALVCMQLERGRELAVLRALGFAPRQLWLLLGLEGGLIGVAAGLLSIPIGLLLAAVLVGVVNRRSFGWTMDLAVEPMVLVQAFALAVAAALLAAMYPAWRSARTLIARGLREE